MVDIANFAITMNITVETAGALFALAGICSGTLCSYIMFVKTLQY